MFRYIWTCYAYLVNQTVLNITVEDYDYDFGFSDTPYVVAKIEMEISCFACSKEDEFASIYPDFSRCFLPTQEKVHKWS